MKQNDLLNRFDAKLVLIHMAGEKKMSGQLRQMKKA